MNQPDPALQHEFPVEREAVGVGPVIIMGLSPLITKVRPALFRHLPFKPSQLHRVLDLGNLTYLNFDHPSRWFLVSDVPAEQIHQRMDQFWSYYAQYSNQLYGLLLDVTYHGTSKPFRQSYGFEDAPGSGYLHIHGREYWRSLHPSGDPAQADWTGYLDQVFKIHSTRPVTGDQLEAFLNEGQSLPTGLPRLVVVRHDEEYGYTPRGFKVSIDELEDWHLPVDWTADNA